MVSTPLAGVNRSAPITTVLSIASNGVPATSSGMPASSGRHDDPVAAVHLEGRKGEVLHG